MTSPKYDLTLGKTYYEKGFFNLGVDVEKYISPHDCDMVLFLGDGRMKITAMMSRKPNRNGTPRVFGKNELRDWFMRNYEMMDKVQVFIESPTTLWIK